MSINGLEKGVAGIGVKGLVPMFYQDEHTGSVEFGMSFGQAFFERFKKEHNVDLTLYILVKGDVTKFGSTLGDTKVVSDELSDITSQSEENIDIQHREVDFVATAMNQMLTTVHEVASNAEEVASSVQKTSLATQEGREIVAQVVESIKVLAKETDNTEQVIDDLKQRITDIDSVLEVISGIADQTNLLALNAAIEAARAGEHGRGFAVVSDEVRVLANRTQDSTEEIKGIIEALHKGSKDSVEAMGRSKVYSEKSVELVHSADQSLEEISESIQVINDMNLQISSASTQQVSVSEEINKNVVRINDVVASSAESATQIAKASQVLAELALEMQTLMGQFKVEEK